MDEDSLTPVFPKVVPHGTPPVRAKGASARKGGGRVVVPGPVAKKDGPLGPEQKDCTLRAASLT